MFFRPRLSQILPFSAAFLSAHLAHAEPSAAQISTARQAFEAAVELEAHQQWVEAAAKLNEAIAVKETPGLRFHLGHCEEEQGLLVEAASDYDRASELIAHGAAAPDVQKLLVPASAELKQRTPHVSVEIPAQAQLTGLSVDAKPVAESDLTQGLALNPGRHHLVVSATGRRSFRRGFTLKEGDAVAIRAVLPLVDAPAPAPPVAPAAPLGSATAVAAPPPPPSARPAHHSGKLYLMLGESAVAVAGLSMGIGFQFSASSAQSRVDSAQRRIDQASMGNASACSAPNAAVNGPCSDLQSAISDHDHALTLSTIGFVGAGVGVAALAATWFAYPKSNVGGVSVLPVVGLSSAGVVGAF